MHFFESGQYHFNTWADIRHIQIAAGAQVSIFFDLNAPELQHEREIVIECGELSHVNLVWCLNDQQNISQKTEKNAFKILYSVKESAQIQTAFYADLSLSLQWKEHFDLEKNASVHATALLISQYAAYHEYSPSVTHHAQNAQSAFQVRVLHLAGQHVNCYGRIVLEPQSAGALASYQNHHMILQGEPIIEAEPLLQISCDDVQCQHGVTIGSVDPEVIFYMTARGVSQNEAQRLFIRSFVAPCITQENIRTIVEDVLLRRV